MEHVRYPLGKTSGLAVAIVRHGYLFCTWEWVLGCLEFWRFYQFILLLLVRLGRITMTNAFSYVNASCAILRSELSTNGNPQEFFYRPRKQHLRKSSCELELRSTATQYSSNHIFSPIDLTLSSTLTENTQTPDSPYPSDPATPGSRASHTPAALSKQLSWHSAACNTSR
jgi:hypothetical protein